MKATRPRAKASKKTKKPAKPAAVGWDELAEMVHSPDFAKLPLHSETGERDWMTVYRLVCDLALKEIPVHPETGEKDWEAFNKAFAWDGWWTNQARKKGLFKNPPGANVAVLNKKIVGYGDNDFLLTLRMAVKHRVHPNRLLVQSLD
jgi:hypothetical protein